MTKYLFRNVYFPFNNCYLLFRFESDMLLQRCRATADFIGNLQDRVDNNMKIEELLTRKNDIYAAYVKPTFSSMD